MKMRFATITPFVVALAIAMPAWAQQQPATAAASTAAECQVAWNSADVNKDGNLTDDELKDYRAVLSDIDANKDGRLSMAEFEAACKEE